MFTEAKVEETKSEESYFYVMVRLIERQKSLSNALCYLYVGNLVVTRNHFLMCININRRETLKKW